MEINDFTIKSSNLYKKYTCREPKKVNAAMRVRKKKRKKLHEERSGSNNSSLIDHDMDYNDTCDDDALDDINLSYVPSDEEPEANFACGICGKQKKAKLWYKSVK